MPSQPDEGALHMWYTTPELIRMLTESGEVTDTAKPWGFERELSHYGPDFTVKYLRVNDGARTSLQVHERKIEMIFILHRDPDNGGFVETAPAVGIELIKREERLILISPGMPHRVTGPLEYLEVSTVQGNDVVRLSDDYGR